MPNLYNPLSAYLKARFNCKVFKVTINTGLSCPNRDGAKGYGGCVYCESATLVPKDYAGETDVREQLAKNIEKVRKRHKADKFIAYFQINTNTHAPVEYLRKIYFEALIPDVIGIAISTRPDCVSDEVLDLLEEIKQKRHLWLELGLQSANDSTLKLINRGHTSDDFRDAALRASKRGIDVCAHAIIGLPGEERADILNTMEFISSLPVWGIKFHQLLVIKGTSLEEMYLSGRVKPLLLEEYAGLVVECLEVLPPQMVVHRLCGDGPKSLIAAPNWGANKFMIIERIAALLKERNTFQGALYRPGYR